MLIVRGAQLAAFAEARRARFVARLGGHLRRHFPDPMTRYTDDELHAHVAAALDDAAAYGLTSPRDGGRFLNLAAAYGWGFDRAPENAWMRRLLLDPDIDAPSARLHALVRECVAREAIAAERRALLEKYGSGTGA